MAKTKEAEIVLSRKGNVGDETFFDNVRLDTTDELYMDIGRIKTTDDMIEVAKKHSMSIKELKDIHLFDEAHGQNEELWNFEGDDEEEEEVVKEKVQGRGLLGNRGKDGSLVSK